MFYAVEATGPVQVSITKMILKFPDLVSFSKNIRAKLINKPIVKVREKQHERQNINLNTI